MNPLYGFGGKRIEPVSVITLLISFGTPKNPHTKYITFDVVDMLYPYNALFGRRQLIHSKLLCIWTTSASRSPQPS
jgi:hypothetical protein